MKKCWQRTTGPVAGSLLFSHGLGERLAGASGLAGTRGVDQGAASLCGSALGLTEGVSRSFLKESYDFCSSISEKIYQKYVFHCCGKKLLFVVVADGQMLICRQTIMEYGHDVLFCISCYLEDHGFIWI